jgi:hypothetical protein
MERNGLDRAQPQAAVEREGEWTTDSTDFADGKRMGRSRGANQALIVTARLSFIIVPDGFLSPSVASVKSAVSFPRLLLFAILVSFCGNDFRRAQIEANKKVNYPREVLVCFSFTRCKHRLNAIPKKLLDRAR